MFQFVTTSTLYLLMDLFTVLLFTVLFLSITNHFHHMKVSYLPVKIMQQKNNCIRSDTNPAKMKLALHFLIEKVHLMMNWVRICGSWLELIHKCQEIFPAGHLPPFLPGPDWVKQI